MQQVSMIPVTVMTPMGPMVQLIPAHMYQQYQYMTMMQNIYTSSSVPVVASVPAVAPVTAPVVASVPAIAPVTPTKLPDFIATQQKGGFRIAKGPPMNLDGENFKARKQKRI